jgi:hypothetical protein
MKHLTRKNTLVANGLPEYPLLAGLNLNAPRFGSKPSFKAPDWAF